MNRTCFNKNTNLSRVCLGRAPSDHITSKYRRMRIKGICFLSMILLLVISCEYEKQEPLKPLAKVSFSSDVVPIFSKSCSTTGCHSVGAITPDLTAANAYSSLVYGGYVDTLAVENSQIYMRLIDKQKPMPPSGNLSQDQINVIYSWIKNGAPNN
jgi:hypothetical protein